VSALVDDLDATVAAALVALGTAVDREWEVRASGLDWSCWSTVEHVADDLFAYAGQIATTEPEVGTYVPFTFHADAEGEAPTTIHAERSRGNAGLLQVLDASRGMLSSLARTRSPAVRGWHPYGVSDPAGFAAMGTVEVLLHVHDVAGPLGVTWDPDPDVVRRVLERLFPQAPADGEPWPTLLRLTGRDPSTPLASWQWDGRVRD
jgi:hypothetical protein